MENAKLTKSSGLISREYSNPVDAITAKIFNIFDVFRGQLHNQDNIQIVLLLVSLYKDGIINQELLSDDFNISKLNKSILESDLKDSHKKTYLSINQMLSDNLTNVICSRNSYLSLYLFNIEHDLLETYFPAAFDDTIYRIAQSQGKYEAELFQPIELTRFMSGLIDFKADARVFNPFGGIASFALNLSEQQTYLGQEVNRNRWILGILRLMAYGKLVNSKYECADSLQEWPLDSKFDLIVSNPPFNMRIDIRDRVSNIQFKNAEQFLIEKGIQSLKVNGKLIAVFSLGILYKGGSELELRKQLLEKDLIDSIISFPGGLFTHTAIPFIVMVLSQGKKLKNKVRFIKADNYVVEKNRREKVLHDELLLNIYNSDVDFTDDVRIIDIDVLSANDYNLSANRYFDDSKCLTELPAGVEVVELGKLVESLGREFTDHDKAQIINISDLAESIDNYEKQVSDFQTGNIPISAQKIDSSVLLLSKIRNLKPTYCKVVEGELLYCNNNIIPLLVDESKVYIPYLILELNSERVSRFVKSRLTGISIPSLNKKDILEIPILLYSLEEQRAKYAGYIEAIAQKKKEELISFSKIHGLESEIHEQNAYLRHTLAGTVSNLDGTLKNIQAILESYALQHPEIWKMKVSDKHKFCLKDYVSNFSRDITKISQTIGKQLFQSLSLSNYPKERIEISEFLASFVDEFNENNNSYKIEYKVYSSYYDDFEMSQEGKKLHPYVYANKKLLTDILNNLIDNVEKHAFDSYSNNRIEIFLMEVQKEYQEQPSIAFLFTNTGKRLPEGFTIDDFARKGNAVGPNAGNGFGGWYINEIIKYFGGTIDLIDEQGSEGLKGDLATSFDIELPVVYEEKL